MSKNKENNRRNKMTKTIKIAKNYQTLDEIINTFNKSFLNYTVIPVFLVGFIFSLMLFIELHSGEVEDSLSSLLYGTMSFFSLVSTFSLFLGSFFMVLAQYFGKNRYFVTSYKAYYKNKFTDAEKSIIEHILDDKFDNIIQTNRKVISKKLKDVKEAMEDEIFNQEYLESFKKDIEANLKERKQYIPLLQSLAEEYHFRDRDNVIMERANQQLTKAGISTFKTKEKTTFEIVEESA